MYSNMAERKPRISLNTPFVYKYLLSKINRDLVDRGCHKDHEQMEQIGVIATVNEPTEWCAGMVLVLKRMVKFEYV